MPAFAALLVVYIAIRAFWWIGSSPVPALDPLWIADGLLKVVLWVVPCAFLVRLTDRRAEGGPWRLLGLTGSPAHGYLFGLIATLPMAAAVLYEGRFSTSLDAIAGTVVLGPLAEEVLFRGFLFLTLRRIGWRLVPAMLVSSMAFAVAHSQSAWLVGAGFFGPPDWLAADSSRALLSLLPFIGIGVVFSWLTHRWHTIWPAIGLHAGINLWWELSPGTVEYASVALTSVAPLPIAHAMTVALAIGLTLRSSFASTARHVHAHRPARSAVESRTP